MLTMRPLLPLLLLAGCGAPLEPIGTYEADPEGVARAYAEATGPAASFARARMNENTSPWRVTLQVRRDQSYEVSMQFGAGPAMKRSGSWTLLDDRIDFIATHDNGQALDKPILSPATLTHDAIELHASGNSPRMQLRRIP